MFTLDSNGVWLTTTTSPLVNNVQSIALSNTMVFAGTSQGVARSTDFGTTWDAPGTGLFESDVRALLFWDGRLFAGTKSGNIFLSKDGASTWTEADSGLTARDVRSITALGQILFAGAWGAGIFRSSDSGTHGAPADSGLTSGFVSALTVDGGKVYVGTYGGGVYVSHDTGFTWTMLDTGLTSLNVQALAVKGTRLIAGTPNGAYASSNGGLNWVVADSGMTNHDIRALTIVRSQIFAGTWLGGLWKRPLQEMVTSATSDRQGTPTLFQLEQNYPNPFNPLTVIQYTVGGNRGWGLGVSDVSLVVYDVLGRQVATLVNEVKAPGTYEVRFDGSGLTSGAYFYRLTAGSFVETKKLILMK
jgi:hypothetical protein